VGCGALIHSTGILSTGVVGEYKYRGVGLLSLLYTLSEPRVQSWSSLRARCVCVCTQRRRWNSAPTAAVMSVDISDGC